jgi:hypothetical protein
VEWRLTDGVTTVDVQLPDGVTGVFRAPDGSESDLAGGPVTLHIPTTQ